MNNAFRRLGALSRAERLLLLKAWLMLPIVQLTLRLLGVRRTRRLLARVTAGQPSPRNLSPARVQRGISRAARLHPWEIRCLARSVLAIAWAPDLELRIGVKRVARGLEAHAWVEEGGTPLGESSCTVAGFCSLDLRPEQL